MEAEFVACYEVMSQVLWLRNFIYGLKIVDSIARPLKFYCDNAAAIFFAKNDKSGSRSKHIEIKHLVVRDHIKNQEVDIQYISIGLIVAEPMTKGLSSKQYKEHVDHMRIVSSFIV